jgi:hypothetical protein
MEATVRSLLAVSPYEINGGLTRLPRPCANERDACAEGSHRHPFGFESRFERFEIANSAGGKFVLALGAVPRRKRDRKQSAGVRVVRAQAHRSLHICLCLLVLTDGIFGDSADHV